MNIFIETLSLYSRERSEEIYRVADNSMLPKGMKVDDIGFTGRQTNEAPTKYIIWSLAQRKEVLDKIYIINSNETIGNELPFINYNTTYTYYRESIIQYIKKLAQENEFLLNYLKDHFADYESKGYTSDAEYYFYSVVDIDTVVTDKVVTGKWKRIVTEISSFSDADLYFDFTGGSRLASLTSMFILRWAESDSTSIKQVIYSDIITNPQKPKIVDCTDTYRVMGKISSAEAAPKDRKRQRRIEVGTELGLNDDEDKRYAEILDKAETDADNDLSGKSDEDIKRIEKELIQNVADSKYGKQEANKVIKDLVDSYKKTPFRKILEKLLKAKSARNADYSNINISTLGRAKIENFINGFYEEFIVALYNAKIINICVEADKPEDWLKGVIKANNDYYYSINGNRGVIPVVKTWLRFSRNQSPIKVYSRNTRIDNSFYPNKVNGWSSLFGVSSKHNQQFLEYLKNEQHIDYSKLSFEKVSEYQRVYFNYGFPFMMVYRGKSMIFPEIMKQYLECTKVFFENLERLRTTNFRKYTQTINRYLTGKDDIELENEIPFVNEVADAWSYNYDIIPEAHRKNFVKKMSDRLEIVRPYRNAIAHRVSYDNEYRQLEKQIRIVEQIVEWLLEYDVMFRKEK